MSWILILDPWVLSPEITLAASLWYLDCPGERKVIKPRSSSKLASVPGLYMEARCKSCTKGLCIWTWKHKQQNSIDHFCFFCELGASVQCGFSCAKFSLAHSRIPVSFKPNPKPGFDQQCIPLVKKVRFDGSFNVWSCN